MLSVNLSRDSVNLSKGEIIGGSKVEETEEFSSQVTVEVIRKYVLQDWKLEAQYDP